MDTKPIPAFYCCYLLRSTILHSSLYVGSTPNPVRRLAQHNGRNKGGAVRTSSEKLRPWEMTCIVSGFPSHIAALQFEWAWQNTHTTRHIPAAERITEVRRRNKRGRPARPRVTLTDKLANLHLLLRVDSFKRWPLELTFFCEDVYRVWRTWNERVHSRIRDGVKVVLDFDDAANRNGGETRIVDKQDAEEKEPRGIERIEVGYKGLKRRLQKSRDLLQDTTYLTCAVCRQRLKRRETSLLATCTSDTCNAVSHLTCLSQHFLDDPATSSPDNEEEAVLPTEGPCPDCSQSTRWIDVVKELTLRVRSEKEVEKLLATPRKRGGRRKRTEDSVANEDEVNVPPLSALEQEEEQEQPKEDDGWRYIDEDYSNDDEEDDRGSVTSAGSESSSLRDFEEPRANIWPRKDDGKKRLEVVIEDSE
ncbi:MAG: Slx4p interacting protein [Peltula sp. TS41687]|nr:MAG: Slx4p interacting protein [Peltula sp. TS41687]